MTSQKPGFQDFKLNKQLWQAIADLNYSNPTPIQIKAIPLILAGHDVMGIAQTGTGKSAAFILPLLMKIKYAHGHHPRALILAPTRELVIQLHSHIEALSKYTDLRSAAIFGGVGITRQVQFLRDGIDILAATPGRFIDLYRRGELVVKDLSILVLDEADKMMDMGFMPQIRKILEVIPVKRQNLLFSATIPDKVVTLSQEFLEYPQIIAITPSATTASTIKQYCYEVPNFKTKINLLGHLLQDHDQFKKVIVFVRTKKTADNLYKYLSRTAHGQVRVIHSNKDQNTRINSMEAFKTDLVRILVTTDVSARGIDVSMVSHVINFEVPLVYEDYVHRIGRTGRARKQGIAITFYNEAERFHLHKIEELIQNKIPRKTLPPEVPVADTGFEEKQALARLIDEQKRRSDPSFKGAFHHKKKSKAPKTGSKSRKTRRRPSGRK